MTPPPPRSTLFPYTTLFRSHVVFARPQNHDGFARGLGRHLRRLHHEVSLVAAAKSAAHKRRVDDNFFEIGRDTSELQSRRDLVCRLLLEKKNHLGGTGQDFS